MSTVTTPPPPTSRRARRAAERASRTERVRPAVRAAPPRWRSPFVLVSVVAVAVMVVAVGALLLTSGRGGGEPTIELGIVRPPDSTIATYAEGDGLGPQDAPVTLEVWSDYQCPVCGRFAREYLPRLVNTFVAAGELRIEERSIDILGAGDPNESLDAAAGAACAGRQGAYWQYHDILMWNQDGENERAFSRDRLAAMATQVGLDTEQLMTCLDDPAVRSAITDRTRQAIADGIDRTPTFLVNGERVVGLVAYADLEAMIRAAVDAAPGS